MDTADILALYDQTQRRDIEFPDMRKEVTPHVTRFVRPAPGMSFILHSRVDATTVEAAIQEQIDYFTPRKQRFEWKVHDYDSPPDLKERLIAHGFKADEPDAIMALDLTEAPPALLAPVTADVRPITRREQLGDVMTVEAQVWGSPFDWIEDRLGDNLAIPGYLSVYVAYVDNQPACAGWTYFDTRSEFASLWGGSTVAQYRERGLYTAVLAVRVQEAWQRGYRFLTIDAGEMSQPIVARQGFRLLTQAHACEWKA
jgi:hypothetical protein